jgi:hypothetical protein
MVPNCRPPFEELRRWLDCAHFRGPSGYLPTENCVIGTTNSVRNCHFPIELETAKIAECLDCRNIRLNIERFSNLPKLVALKRPRNRKRGMSVHSIKILSTHWRADLKKLHFQLAFPR